MKKILETVCVCEYVCVYQTPYDDNEPRDDELSKGKREKYKKITFLITNDWTVLEFMTYDTVYFYREMNYMTENPTIFRRLELFNF